MNIEVFKSTQQLKEEGRFKAPIYLGNEVRNNSHVILDNDDITSMLICGMTGTGKSWALYNILYNAVLNKNKYIIMDYKKDYINSKLSELNHSLGYYTEPSKYINVLIGIEVELEKRYGIMKELGVCRWGELANNKEVMKNHHVTFIVIEELGTVINTLRDKGLNKEFVSTLTSLTKLCRCAGIKFILITQRAIERDLPMTLLNECSVKLLFKLPDNDLERMGIDVKHKVDGVGNAILVTMKNEIITLKANKIADNEKGLLEIIESL